MTAMYRMRSQTTSLYNRYSQEKISPFCRMILKIAHGLSEDEVSQLKLALLVDKHVRTHGITELKNGAEVLLYLYSKNLISKTEASLLIELLKEIKRVDLATLVENHFKEELNEALEAVAISSRQSPLSESSAREPYSFQSTIGETSRESSSTFPNPLPRLHQLKEEDMSETPSSSQSSQMSICVDDVLSLSQDSLMSLSDDEKFSQIQKSAFQRTDDQLEAFYD